MSGVPRYNAISLPLHVAIDRPDQTSHHSQIRCVAKKNPIRYLILLPALNRLYMVTWQGPRLLARSSDGCALEVGW